MTATPESATYHAIGVRDGYANVLATVRAEGLAKGVRTIARELLAMDKDHPHAQWILEHVEATTHD